jgi:UDP-N-acetylmuramoylalanine--D-glutamate ligase
MQKRYVILGSGESGTGAARLAQQVGYDVFVSDGGAIAPRFVAELEALGIAYESGSHDLERILAADVIVKSPGIPEKSPVMRAIREKGIEVIGEIELGWLHVGPCKIVAITGSNGKTTTTYLTHHLLKDGGLDARMGGNVGASFAAMVADDLKSGHLSAERVFVLEVSSFQLDDTASFRPDVALLLNITPDHLDRYDYELAKYVASKFRITMNQQPSDVFITNADDPNVQGFMAVHTNHVRARMEQVTQSDLRNGYVRVGELAFDLTSSALQGPHNRFNAAASVRAALHCGVAPEGMGEALYNFTPPPHRMERVGMVQNVMYINDSKATNVDSVFYALQSMTRPTVWIVGGVDKGNDYTPLMPHVRQWVKAIVCMGVDNARLHEVFGPLGLPMTDARSAQEAVAQASQLAESGDSVLLSPACASFDLFRNYEDRGDQFRTAVKALEQEAQGAI